MEVRYYPALITFLAYNPLHNATTPGQAIRGERLTRGWSRRKLALTPHDDEATVRRIEEDAKRIRASPWTHVAGALGLD